MSAQVALWVAGTVLLVASMGFAALTVWTYRTLSIRGLRAELEGLTPTGSEPGPDVDASAAPYLPSRLSKSGEDASATSATGSFHIISRQVVTTCELGIEE